MTPTKPLAYERIRHWRQHRGWSLSKLSESSGIEMTTLSRIENGDRRFRIDHLERICSALGLTEAEFYALTPIPSLPDQAA